MTEMYRTTVRVRQDVALEFFRMADAEGVSHARAFSDLVEAAVVHGRLIRLSDGDRLLVRLVGWERARWPGTVPQISKADLRTLPRRPWWRWRSRRRDLEEIAEQLRAL